MKRLPSFRNQTGHTVEFPDSSGHSAVEPSAAGKRGVAAIHSQRAGRFFHKRTVPIVVVKYPGASVVTPFQVDCPPT